MVLQHKRKCIQDDKQENEVFEWGWGHKTPCMVPTKHQIKGTMQVSGLTNRFDWDCMTIAIIHVLPEPTGFIWNVQFKRSCLNCKIYAGFLVLVHIVLKFSLTKLIECDDDESNKNVDKEKWEDYKEHNVEYALLRSEPRNWAFIFISGWHGILKDAMKAFVR